MTNIKISKIPFGKTSSGEEVDCFVLENANNTKAYILTYGGIIQKFVFNDQDIVAGFDSVEDYENDSNYIGALIGRVANRIGKGKFELDGIEYQIPVNDGPNTNHGGLNGFNRKNLTGQITENNTLLLTGVSPDGEEGFPGTVEFGVEYNLTDNDDLIVTLSAQTDKRTPINLTMHPYFVLDDNPTIYDYQLQVGSNEVTEIDHNLLPTGQIVSVENKNLDFTTPKNLGNVLTDKKDEQINQIGGIDNNFVFKTEDDDEILPMIKVSGDDITLSVSSDQPGLQIYTGNSFDLIGKNGRKYFDHGAIAIEPQNFPDSINHQNFPNSVLEPNEKYQKTIIYHVEEKDD